MANEEPTPADELLTAYQAARVLGVSTRTIHAWTNRRKLRPQQIGKRTRFRREDVLRLKSGKAPSSIDWDHVQKVARFRALQQRAAEGYRQQPFPPHWEFDEEFGMFVPCAPPGDVKAEA